MLAYNRGALLLSMSAVLQVLIIGGNPAVHADSFEEYVSRARTARPTLDIAWQASDPGQTEG